MKLKPILLNAHMSQGFGANDNPLYAGWGQKGHTGQDWVSQYNSPIFPAVPAEVYSIINQFNPDPMKYRAVYQIYDDVDFSYEISYGHCNEIMAKEGEFYGDKPLATEGNTGDVYSGGHYVTKEEKLGGSIKGHHVHFQVRKCIRVPKVAKGKQYLRDSNGKLKRAGYYYEIVDYDNGYNGCIDPLPFQKDRPHYVFKDDLNFKDKGEEIEKLQEILRHYGTFTYPEITGYYGEETRKAVYAFQTLEKVAPWAVIQFNRGKHVHSATRRRLNELYSGNQ